MTSLFFLNLRRFASACPLASVRLTSKELIFRKQHAWGLLSRRHQLVPARLYYLKPKKKKNIGLKGLAIGSVALSAIAGFSVIILGRPRSDEDLKAYSSESFLQAYLKRSWAALVNYYNDFAMPSNPLLLPDPLPPPYQAPYTLVLELNDLLIHSTYELKTGWRHRRRPGLTTFLKQLAPFFEIVIFTTEAGFSAQPIVGALDPKGEMIFYSLYRDSTTYTNGKHVKDLNYLNRDLSKVIAIDIDSAACERNENNCLVLKKWEGDSEDTQLQSLAAFLQSIVASGVDDVRPVLEHYRKEENPLETFRERQNRLAQQVAEQLKQQEEEKKKKTPARGTSWLFRGFGRNG